jgi:hypothetical protein
MTFLINTLGFLTFFYLFAYLPGSLILKKLKIKSFWDLDLSVGITILGTTLFFGRWLFSSNLLLLLIFLISAIYASLNYKKIQISFPKIKLNYALLFVLFLGATAQSLPYILSLAKGEPFIFYDLISNHDQAWHTSLIFELTNHFPPQIPGFSGVVLKNYHYLYDLILAANLKLFNLNISYLLQGIYPIAISLFFGLSIYRVTTLLTKDKLTPILAVFFGYFANNLSFILQFFGKKDWQISNLIFDQPIIYLFNHQTVLSISIVIYLAILLSKSNLKKLNIKKALLISLGLTSLILLKIYAFIVIISALTIYWVLNYKNKNLFLILCISGLISLAYLLLTFNFGGKFIDFNPGWVAEAFFDKTLAPIFPKLLGLQAIWKQQHVYFKTILLKIFSLLLLLTLSFHLRLVGFLGLFYKKTSSLYKLLLLTSLSSLLFTLIGNQSISAYNIIQFIPYSIIGTTILSLVNIKNYNSIIKKTIIFLFILFSLSSLKEINSYLSQQTNFSALEKTTLLKELNEIPDGVLISFTEENNENNLLSSVSRKRSFYSDQKQLIVLGLNYQERLEIIDQLNTNFCEFTTADKDIIAQHDLKYFLTSNNQPCNDPSLEIIKSSNSLSLYEYKN